MTDILLYEILKECNFMVRLTVAAVPPCMYIVQLTFQLLAQQLPLLVELRLQLLES